MNSNGTSEKIADVPPSGPGLPFDFASVDFDLNSPEFNEHYDSVVSELVERCPVAHSGVGDGYWIVSRYEDVRRCAQDWTTFSSSGGFQENRPAGMPRQLPVEADPPYHQVMRTAIQAQMSPKVIRQFEPSVRRYVNDFIDAFADRGECDFVREFAALLPGTVFLRNMVGIPESDLPTLMAAFDMAFAGPVESRALGWQAAFEYVDRYLRARSQEPSRGDFVDAVLQGVESDCQPTTTTDFDTVEWNSSETTWDAKCSVMTSVMSGGLGTTTAVLAGAVHHLAAHPEDRRRLVERPDLIPVAVEEFLRFYAPGVTMGRTATADVEVNGQLIPKGEFVSLAFAMASRDPARVSDPNTVDIERSPNPHAAFGIGSHRCTGSHLARLNLRIALEEFLRRIPTFAVAPGTELKYETTSRVRSLVALPLIFERHSPSGDETGSRATSA